MSTSRIDRPTIGLALIVKNERKNLERLFKSFSDCFDEVHVTDTGSTDGTVEWIKEHGKDIAGCPVHIHHFTWINDFAAARNYSFSHVKTDYICWIDADDCLKNKDGFINWRNGAMAFADVAFVHYNYALNPDGSPIISFVRERVFRRSIKPNWQYRIHEGVMLPPGLTPQHVVHWSIDHHRDAEDIQADKSRNLKVLEEIKLEPGGLDPRLKFYYGKELYEQSFPYKAIEAFDDALKEEKMERHDKILSYQYAAYSAMACADQIKDEFLDQKMKYFEMCAKYCFDGIKYEPHRAEIWTILGDMHIKMGNLRDAIPYYSAAKGCINPKDGGSKYEGAIYNFVDCYGLTPTLQLAKIYFNLGMLEKAVEQAKEAIEKYDNQEAKDMMAELDRIKSVVNIDNNQQEVNEIVISCPPYQAYPFDEEIYKTKPLGGSETALVQMAKYLKELTGLPVKVFNQRESDLIADSGVEYLSNKDLPTYFSKNKPRVHVAWRHNIELTRATTYLWCHDLQTPTVESKMNFDKFLALSGFHKEYTMGLQGVPEDKIIVTRNGITPEKFNFERKTKNPNKIVWMSSPDRGLINAIPVLDIVRETHPDIELHVYYGIENLYKYGLGQLADRLKQMMSERPWIKYHGFTEQSKMYQDVSDAVIWLHPNNFIETFCITAIEMLALGVYPIVRRLGALKNTLAEAFENGSATYLDHDAVTPEERKAYAIETCKALDAKKWNDITFDITKHDWKIVAKEWCEFMGLDLKQ